MGERRATDPMILPRLRVAVRVISEDDYLQHLAQGPPGPTLYASERKFPIIISNPQSWKIGHLVAEIRRQFRQSWGREIDIRYLSHGLDDCQLHKDLSVYDHLYDEGKAQSDSSDQKVVVKAVYSQGRPLREGSILPDFEDPSYNLRPIPPIPVPSWSDIPPRSGKRRAELDEDGYYGQDNLSGSKQPRLTDDVEHAATEGGIMPSVEQDETADSRNVASHDSPVLVQDSQSSPQREQRRIVQHPKRSSAFPARSGPEANSKLGFVRDTSTEPQLPTVHGERLSDGNRNHNQTLLTPPSDASKRTFSGNTNVELMQDSRTKNLPTSSSSTGLRKPSRIKNVAYDIEAVDPIVYTQRSPNSREAVDNTISSFSLGPHSSQPQNARGTPLYKGNIPHGEIVKLMEINSKVPKTPLLSSSRGASNLPADDAAAEEEYSETPATLSEKERPNMKNAKSFEALSNHPNRDHLPLINTGQISAKQPESSKKKRRVRNKFKLSESLSSDSPQNTHQSTPVDSPGEQLLEMQASSQKVQSNQISKDGKKAAKRSKKQPDKSKKAEDTQTKEISTKAKQPQSQRKGNDLVDAGSAQIEPASRQIHTSGKLLKNSTGSDALEGDESSSDDDGNKSDSSISSPSKNVTAKDTPKPVQQIVEKKKPILPFAEPSRLETPRSTSVFLPIGMTLEQFEAKRKKYEEEIANGKVLPKKQRRTSDKNASTAKNGPQVPLSLTSDISKERSLSATPSEAVKSMKTKKSTMHQPSKEEKILQTQAKEMIPKTKKKHKEENTHQSTEENGSDKRVSAALEDVPTPVVIVPLAKEKKAKKLKATVASTPSTVSSASRSASAASGLPASAPAKVISSTAAPSKISVSSAAASRPSTTAGPSLLKGLRNRIADKSAKSSPAPQSAATPVPKPASKLFAVGGSDDDDDDDEDESSDEDEDEEKLREKTTRIMAASKPDVSTRNQTVESDSEDDDEEDDTE